MPFEDAKWFAEKIRQAFPDAVSEYAQDGDRFWINPKAVSDPRTEVRALARPDFHLTEVKKWKAQR